MFKRIVCLFLVSVSLLFFFYANKKPVLSDFSKTYEISIKNYSSAENLLTVSQAEFLAVYKVCGESVTLSIDDISESELIEKLHAIKVFENEINGEKHTYYFSYKIKYGVTLNGRTVNLHIALNGDKIKIGTPIIYGSF